jgi:hypothetical protein
MTRPGIRETVTAFAIFACGLLACLAAFNRPLHAQAAQTGKTISIRMYDARTGRQLDPNNFVVRLDHQDEIHNESLHIDDEGTGRITVPASASFLSVQGTFDNSMEIYFNCDAGKEKIEAKLHWYSVSDILSTGVVAPNECFNGKYERPRIEAKPGEFLFYVRSRNWRDPGSY